MKKFFHGIFRRRLATSSTESIALGGPTSPPSASPPQEPPLNPQQTSENARHNKPADRLKGALGITYDVAKIVAGNFPLPGLQSMIGLVDYVKELHDVRYSVFHLFCAGSI
jgi:hypothetical protein